MPVFFIHDFPSPQASLPVDHTSFSTVNLSNYQTTLSDLTLLEKGLSFIPSRKTLPISNIVNSKNRLIRTIKLKSYFKNKPDNRDTPDSRRFTLGSTWTPGDDKLDDKTLNLVDQIQICTSEAIRDCSNRFKYADKEMLRCREEYNITREERESLMSFKNNKDILIKPADKGGATVILNKENYKIEAYRQLDNVKYYKKLKTPIFTNNIPKIKLILNQMLEEKYITKNQFSYLSGPAEIKNRTFYLLPKIHKKKEVWPQPGKMPEGRPIVSDVDSETYRVSEYIDYYLNPLANKHESYLKNTYDFIDKIRNYAVQNNYLLVTGDVTALYTNMDIDRSLRCVEELFQKNPVTSRPDQHILKLLEIAMRFNDFEFNGDFFLQTMGTAMGKRFAPSLANIYMLDFDKAAMHEFKIKPLLFFRYLDDIFFLWPGDINSLKEYETFLNNLIPDIKVTLEYNLDEINFLDTTVYKTDNKLCTRVYFKPTDTHQLLHKSSFHPKHVFKGLLKSQLIRFKRISSTKLDYDNTSKILFSSLKQRGYSVTEMRKAKNDVWFLYKEEPKKNKNDQPLIPIILDYCSFNQNLGKDLKNLINNDDNLKDNKVIVAFKNSKNLKQLLIKSKLEGEGIGAFRGCGESRCKTCRIHAYDSSSFYSTSYNRILTPSDNTTCNSSNLIYLITCNKCKLQYVGETGRSLRERLTDHKSAIKLKRKTPIGLHFNLPEHSFLDMRIIGLELIKNNDENCEIYRKSREKDWQRMIGTIYPRGLNAMPID